MTKDLELTTTDYLNIAHSLGIDLYKAIMSNKLKDKVFPKEFYRNFYNIKYTSPNFDEIKKLVDLGLMVEGKKYFFSVTEDGIDELKEFYKWEVIYIPKNLQIPPEYLAMLHKANVTGKINFYCDYHEIDLGVENNAQLIIDKFSRDYLEGFPISDKITRVIKKFEKDLRNYF